MKTMSLGDLSSINPSTPKLGPSELISFVGMGDLDEVRARTRPGESRTFSETAKGYTQFLNGDLLVAKITPCFENGKIGQAILEHAQGSGSSEFHVVRVDESLADPRYILRFLRQGWIRSEGERRMTGSAGQRRVPPSFLRSLVVPVPPIEDQREVAARMDRVSLLSDRLRAHLGLLDELVESLFMERFGHWDGTFAATEAVAADEAGSIRTGPFGSQLLHSEFVDEGIAVLGIDNVVKNHFVWGKRRYISEEKYQQLRRYTVRPGDVLITIMGTCGRCVVVPAGIPKSINTKHLCAITLNQSVVLPEFVRACFLWHPTSRRFLKQRAKGSIMDGLNMGIIREMPLPLPSLYAQQEFVDASATIALERLRTEGILEEMQELFRSLEAEAFGVPLGLAVPAHE